MGLSRCYFPDDHNTAIDPQFLCTVNFKDTLPERWPVFNQPIRQSGTSYDATTHFSALSRAHCLPFVLAFAFVRPRHGDRHRGSNHGLQHPPQAPLLLILLLAPAPGPKVSALYSDLNKTAEQKGSCLRAGRLK